MEVILVTQSDNYAKNNKTIFIHMLGLGTKLHDTRYLPVNQYLL